MKERWKTIPKAPRYEVSDRGRVRNIETGCILKANPRRTGVCCVRLVRDGRQVHLTIQSLVAQAFMGRPPRSHVVHRIDRVPGNNRVGNLYYAPRGGGHHTRGEARPGAVLTEKAIRAIRRATARNDVKRGTQNRLARKYGVSRQLIHLIVKHKVWTHI